MNYLSRTNKYYFYPRCHLEFTAAAVPLAGYWHIPGMLRLPHVAEYSDPTHPLSHPLTAPSAVHLTTCFSPVSHHHRLSVKASLPLSPLQRFSLLNYMHYITVRTICQYSFFLFCTKSPVQFIVFHAGVPFLNLYNYCQRRVFILC